MQLNHLRLLILCTIICCKIGVIQCQNNKSIVSSEPLLTTDSLKISSQLQDLSRAEQNYFCTDYIESYLDTKYDIFQSLISENNDDLAYKFADFDDTTFVKLHQIAPIDLENYYNKILRYSIQNKKFKKLLNLATNSINRIKTTSRADSIYLSSNLRQIGLVHRYMGEYETSFDYLYKVLNLGLDLYGDDHIKITDPYYNIGINHLILGEYNKGLEYILTSTNIKLEHYPEDDIAHSYEYNALGLTYEALGKYDLALEYHNKTIAMKKSTSDGFTLELGRSYMNLGTLLLTMDKPQLAFQKSKYALSELNALDSKGKEMKIWLHNSIGRSLIAMDRPAEACKYLYLGLEQNTNKYDLSIDASLEQNLGMALMKTGEYDQAIQYLLSAQEKFIKDSPGHQRISNLDIAISQCYLYQKEYLIAEKIALKALYVLQNKLSKKHPLLFQPYYQLGKIYNETKNKKKSLEYVNKIDLLSNISNLNKLKTINLKLQLYEGDDIGAFEAEKEKGHIDISKALRGYIPTEERYLLSSEIKLFYNLCLKNWKPSTDQDNIDELVNIFNNSKSSILKANVLSNQVTTYTDVPSNVTRREYDLAKRIRYLESSTVYNYDTLDQTTAKLNITSLEKTQLQYKKLLDSIEQYYPKYFDLKFSNENSTANQLLGSIVENTVALDFFEGEDFIWTLSIYNGNVNLSKKPIDAEWNQKLLEFKNSLTDYNTILDQESYNKVYDQFVEQSSQIYDYLLAEPICKLPTIVSDIIIIPDGILNFIPFEILLQSNTNVKAEDYRNLDYLINTYNISYAYSISLIDSHNDNNNNDKNNQASKTNYSGYAPKYRSVNNSNSPIPPLADLPASRQSVEDASKLFEGKSYVSDQATKANFLDFTNQSAILHLAMHCVIDNNSPMDTKLMFDSDSDDEVNYLKASDLYNLRLDNKLSVLTACNTGVGQIRKGEGVISLSRAFTYAGSESLMMSLWNVPDAQTASIVKSFFSNIKSGMPKAESLKRAKIKYLNEAPKSASHPMFWAGFILSGDTDPVRLTADFNTVYYLLPLLGLLLFFLYRNRRLQSKIIL